MDKLVLITPVYNEEQTLDQVIKAVINQSVKPALWVLVNDNSTDKSVDIIKKYVIEYSWISLISAPLMKPGNYGPKIVSVRTIGYEYLQQEKIEYDYLGHLDADIILPPDYYESIIESFKRNEKLGICGGILRDVNSDKPSISKKWWVRDGLRVYRGECTNQAGYQLVMWPHDSSDLLYALFKGWQVLTISCIATHLRPTGNKMQLNYCYYIGRDIRRLGYNFLSAIFKSYKYSKKRPYILGTIYFLTGYLVAAITSKTFVREKDFRLFLNKFYLQNL